MKFKVLGSFKAIDTKGELRLTAPKLRNILALLVVCNNQTVQLTDLIDEIWGNAPPVSAQPTLQTYIYKLRKILLASDCGNDVSVETSHSGYVLATAEGSVDFHRFERMLHEGRKLLPEEPEEAAKVLADALTLWRGPALADISVGNVLAPHVARLGEHRLAALDLRVEADLRLGKHKALISELRGLTKEYPLQETFYAQLMLALYRSGRASEALQAYRQLRKVLVTELGLEPTPHVQGLHQAILASDPALDLVPGAVTIPKQGKGARPVPSQLPLGTPDLVRRHHELKILHEYTMANRESRSSAATAVITGAPGMGKTTLAVNFARSVIDSFPDGQLIATLNGDTPVEANGVLAQFLRAANVPGPLPDDLDEREKLFRSWGARRQVVVILDDVESFAQVRPLILSGPKTITLITSRNRLVGLPGGCSIELGMLTAEDGILMLENIVGPIVSQVERDAAQAIVKLCGYIPLAVRAAGNRLAATRNRSLTWFMQQLRDQSRRLDRLEFDDVDPGALYDRAYRRLTTAEMTILRLLTLLPEGSFDTPTVAKLLRHDWDAIEEVLSRLADLHFLVLADQQANGTIRYRFNELARAYATERLERDLTLEDRLSAGLSVGQGQPQLLDLRRIV